MADRTNSRVASTNGQGVLETRELSKNFGGLAALQRLDMQVQRGEIRAIIGPNGSGKTTLINIISGVYTPTAGEVLFGGENITRLPPHKRAQLGISRTFQTIRLFKNLTVLQNVMIAQACRSRASTLGTIFRSPLARREERLAREKALQILELVRLATKVGWMAGNLAYGQQRLLELARALATEPSLLLLDEPAAGLHPHEAQELMALIRTIRDNGTTIVLIEHNMHVVMDISDRITVLDFGKKIAEGSPEEVRNDPAVIEAYLGRIAEDISIEVV